MKIIPPKLEISETDGFSKDLDIFKLKNFGEKIANLIENSNENLIIALHAPWGEGKTTFVKMWQGYLMHHREIKIPCIYYNAFQNDYQKDPFFAIISEIYNIFKEKEDKSKRKIILTKAKNVIKALSRGALKIGIKAITGNIIDGSILDSVEKDVSTLLSKQVDTILEQRIKEGHKGKISIQNFKKNIDDMILKKFNSSIIFIIDELDRCRPDFALETLEVIKHLFSHKSITFLLVLNKKQLEDSIKSKYGYTIDEHLYLQKFINIWISLPRTYLNSIENDEKKYFDYFYQKMQLNSNVNKNGKAIIVMKELIQHNKNSLREIEHILVNYALLFNITRDYIEYYQYLYGFVCYIRAVKFNFFENIIKDNVDLKLLLKELRLDIIENKPKILSNLKLVLRYDLSNDIEVREIKPILSLNDLDDPPGIKKIQKICSWFTNIDTNIR